MPILQYETRVSPEGFVTLPAIPEYHGRKVVVRIEDDDDWPTPTDEQLEKMYTMCRGVLEGMTREEYDQLREERIMGVQR